MDALVVEENIGTISRERTLISLDDVRKEVTHLINEEHTANHLLSAIECQQSHGRLRLEVYER